MPLKGCNGKKKEMMMSMKIDNNYDEQWIIIVSLIES